MDYSIAAFSENFEYFIQNSNQISLLILGEFYFRHSSLEDLDYQKIRPLE